MKTVYFFILLGVFLTTAGCNLKSDHPQSEIADTYATDLNAKTITDYASSIDNQLSKYTKQSSLVYFLGDLSFYVEKYNENEVPVLIIEHAYVGASSKSIKKYYFKNDSLILENLQTALVNDEGTIFKNVRTYLRSNTVFRQESRTASSEASLKMQPFIDVPLSTANTSDHGYLQTVNTLDDVVNGRDKFDMVFDNITTYPDSRYIILRSKDQSNYMASVLVKDRDPLVDSLLNDPRHFKNQKLQFNWTIKDHEAVYVPK